MPGSLLGAGVDVHADSLGEVGGAGGKQFFEGCAGLVELCLLHKAERGFVLGEGMGARAVGGCWRDPSEGVRTFDGGASGGLHRGLCGSCLLAAMTGGLPVSTQTLSAEHVPVFIRNWDEKVNSADARVGHAPDLWA